MNGTVNAKSFNPKSDYLRIGELINNPFLAVLLSLTENRHPSNLENNIKKQTTFRDRKLGTLYPNVFIHDGAF